MSVPVAIVGGGAFGRALAAASARAGRQVVLWSRTPRSFEHSSIRWTDKLSDLGEAELLFLAVPSVHVSSLASELGAYLDGGHLVVHVSRGLIGDDLVTLTEVLRERTAVRRLGALAGPLVARSLEAGEPAGAIIGTGFPEVADAVRQALVGPTLRLYTTDDVTGVELASAFVGMLALVLGYTAGAGFGPSTMAMLATRGMAEAARIGVSRGGKEKTFAGLAGYGDLIAAVAGDKRPEFELGRALAEGLQVGDAATRAGAYVEGVSIAAQVSAYALRYGVEVPITASMAKIVGGKTSREEVVAHLMMRPVTRE